MKKNLILIFCVLLGLAWFTAISDAINNPKKAQEHLAKARELESQGIYVDAITEYEEALEYWPQDVEISLVCFARASICRLVCRRRNVRLCWHMSAYTLPERIIW